MTNFEIFQKQFDALKKCPPEEFSKHSLAILETYLFLEKAEQKEYAETLYNWAKQHARRKPLLLCYAMLIQSFSLFYRELYNEAMGLLPKTQALFTEQNDMNGAAVCMVLQGSIYRTFGNLDLALKALWEAHEQLIKSDEFQHFFLACNVTMGGTYFEMKHYEEAIPLFQNTLEIAERNGRYYWIIYSLHGLGKVYLALKRFTEAKECFEKAMAVSEKYNHPLSLCNSLSELGNFCMAMGQFPEAEQFHTQSLVLREHYQFIGGAITSCIRLGEIYIRQSKLEDSLAILNKGLRLAEQIHVKLKMYQIHHLFSKIYELKNDPGKSLSHFKVFHELREEVELEDNARKIKNLQLVFEAEQTKKENIIIKKQKEEIEKKNIELQETIDELTRARIGKKARAITLIIAIVLFILEDTILHFALSIVPANNYIISMIVKMVIIFSLGPINKSIEKYLLNKLIKKQKREVMVPVMAEI